MGLYYPQQHTKALVGSKNATTLEITTATLTTAYTGNNKIITTDYMPQITLYIEYTPGSGGNGNSIQIKNEFSSDGVNFHQETAQLASPGSTNDYVQEHTFNNNDSTVALTTYKLRIPIQMADKYFKLSVKETVVGGSAGIVFIEALLSGK